MLRKLKAWLCSHDVHLVRKVISGDIEDTASLCTIVLARRCVWCERMWILEVTQVNLEEPL